MLVILKKLYAACLHDTKPSAFTDCAEYSLVCKNTLSRIDYIGSYKS